MVDADPVRLEQVIANLLNNAAKYTDRGGEIRLTVEHTEDTVSICVRDTSGSTGSRPIRKRGASIAFCAGMPPSTTLRMIS